MAVYSMICFSINILLKTTTFFKSEHDIFGFIITVKISFRDIKHRFQVVIEKCDFMSVIPHIGSKCCVKRHHG